MGERKLTLRDKERISTAFKELSLEISNYTFANLYLFLELERGVDALLEDENSWLVGRMRDGTSYLMPTVSPEKIVWNQLHQLLATRGGVVFPLPKKWVEAYEAQGFKCSYNRDDSDYLVNTEKMANYPGRHLQAKRNLVNQFKRLYSHESRDLDPLKDLSAVQELLRLWQSRAKDSLSETDLLSINSGLESYRELDLYGRITTVDSRAVSVVIGQPLNSNTYVVYAAKGDTDYKGVYQYALMDFACQIEGKYICLNLEEDIGLDSLRKSKLSYQPEQLVHKYRANSREIHH